MLESLNIVRDCYWAMPSGTRYMMDETGALSTLSHGFYPKFNATDSQYVRASDSGEIRYYGRLESTNIDTTAIDVLLRAECQPEGSAVLQVNNYTMDVIPVSGGINDYSTTIYLTNQQKSYIHNGRINKNYDYFDIKLGSNNADTSIKFRAPDFWMDAGSGVFSDLAATTEATDGQRVLHWKSRDDNNYSYTEDQTGWVGSDRNPYFRSNAFGGMPGIDFFSASGNFLFGNEITPITSTSGTFYAIIVPHNFKRDMYIFNQGESFGPTNSGSFCYLQMNWGGTGNSWENIRPRFVVRQDRTVAGEFATPMYWDAVGDSGNLLAIGWTQQASKYSRAFKHWEINGSGQQNYATQSQPFYWGDARYLEHSSIGLFYMKDNPGSPPTLEPSKLTILELMSWDTPLSSGELVALNRYIYDKYSLYGEYTPAQMKLCNIEISYSGDNTWDNHITGLPNVITETVKPSQVTYPAGSNFAGSGEALSLVSYSGVDNSYITNNYYGNTRQWTSYPSLGVGRAMEAPSGYLSLNFRNFSGSGDPFTQITRARLNLRMSLPIISGDNTRDTFEVNGYNARYKNQDHREELAYVNASQTPRYRGFGYYLYGAGQIVSQSGFQTYNVELNFLNPSVPSGDFASRYHASSDMLANINMELIGLPSGTKISGAELQFEYDDDDSMSLYTIGSKTLVRCATSGTVDAGTLNSYTGGHGGWHHQGWRLRGPTVVEEDVFTNFYTFSEGYGNTRTYPETVKAYYFPTGDEDETVYGDYILVAPRDPDDDITAYLKEPQRREYYRYPIDANDLTPAYESELRDISAFKPHFYRHMIYHGASLDYVDVEPGDGDSTQLATGDLCQIWFGDRIGFTEDLTLYFSLYRDYGFQSYGRFFHRGLCEDDGVTNYEIYGDLEPNIVRFTIQGANGTDNRVEVEINQYTKEPILIWFQCGYEAEYAGMTTMTLNVHQDTKNYFSRDWIRAQTHFTGRRKQYSSNSEIVYRPDGTPYTIVWGGPRTVIGTLNNLDVYEQMSRRLYLHRVSPVEFGYANEYITLDHTTGTSSVTQSGYDSSADKDKRFLSTRVSNSLFLNENPSGVRWVVPTGSGQAQWRTRYNVFEEWSPSNIHSVYNPISTAGTNEVVHPSAVWVEMDLTNSTDHPSGLTVEVDVEFDSGTSDNWKVAHTIKEGIPSGGAVWLQYSPITYTTATNKHINMDDEVIRWTDIQNINVTLTTTYPGIGEDEYHGSVEVRSLKVYFDAYCIAATGINDLTLYTHGEATTLNNQLDLYVEGSITYPVTDGDGALDLYIKGIPYYASGDMPLYTHGKWPPVVLPDDDGALNLFIEGLDPPEASGDLDMYVWGTANPGIRSDATLFVESNLDPDHRLPLYITTGIASGDASLNLVIGNYPDSAGSGMPMYMSSPTQSTNNMTLYINTPSGTEGAFVGRGNMPLFIARDSEASAHLMTMYLANKKVPGTLNTFIEGAVTRALFVPLYISGSGAPPNDSINLYTSGF